MKEEIRKLVGVVERKADGNQEGLSYGYTDSEAARHARELCAAIREMDQEIKAWRDYMKTRNAYVRGLVTRSALTAKIEILVAFGVSRDLIE